MTKPFKPAIPSIKNPIELAWAAGFFDGEGTTWVHGEFDKTSKNHGKHPPAVSISISNTNTDMLERFKKAVGRGRVYGPYNHKAIGPRRPIYRYQCNTRMDTAETLDMLLPYLSGEKIVQAL